MASNRTGDEDPLTSETSEPVAEADALEQAEEVAPAEDDDLPSDGAEVPEADAVEQSRVVPLDDDGHSQ
jgi:hypothetical protein